MFKKMFALASVTALTGLVATVAASGCSSTTTTGGDTPETGVPVAEGGVKKPEAGTVEPEETGPATCPTTAAIDATQYAWKPPVPQKAGACTSVEIDSLVKYIDNNKMASYADLKKQIKNAGCASCLFVVDGTNWGPFVEKADGSFERLNFGGCVAVASGKESCGKAYSQIDECINEACVDCAQDQATIQKCSTAALKGACKTAQTALAAECPDQSALTTCDGLATTYTFEAAARALCVGLGDGGDGG